MHEEGHCRRDGVSLRCFATDSSRQQDPEQDEVQCPDNDNECGKT